MYHKVKIGQLSHTQISRLLNGHGIRVSHGSNHEIELSKEQLKKYMKAHEKGKAMTLTLDPFQMQAHQHLRGCGSGGSSGSGVNRAHKFNRWVDTLGARDVIDAGMSKSASTINGMGVNRAHKFNRWVDTLGARDVINAGMSKSASTINGMGVNRAHKFNRWVDTLGARDVINAGMSKSASTINGMGVNRAHKFNRWVDTIGARPVIEAGMSKSASTINGFGLKKRTHKKKSMKGSALMPAGY
jgi:hypothetical protein